MVAPSYETQGKGYSKMKRGELWNQLTNVINLRSSQDQVLWNIFGVFWAANAILLVALFPNGSLPTSWSGTVIGFVGLFLSIIWYLIQKRALGHLERHETLMTILEKELAIEPTYAVSAELNRELYDKYLKRGCKARDVMRASSIGVIIFWSGVLAFFIFRIYVFLIIRMY